jgi:nitroreductase
MNGGTMSDPGLFEIMFSMRAMRRLKSDPIPQEVVDRLLTAGTQAPSGMNSQPWAFLAIQDQETKKFIQEKYHQGLMERMGQPSKNRFAADTPLDRNIRAVIHLAEHMHEAPLLLIVCGKRDWPYQTRPEHRTGKPPPNYGAVYPCVQNILLACRALRLGASLTTTHRIYEAEIAGRLGVPDDYGLVVLMPIGYPKGRFGPVKRVSAAELTHYDRWGNQVPPQSDPS